MIVGQQRQMELLPVFGYELCAIPSSLLDEYGCLCKGGKFVLDQNLAVKQSCLEKPNIVIVDAQQLLYHVVWPNRGFGGVLAESLEVHLAQCTASE